MDREQARQEALKRAKRRKMGRSLPMKKTKMLTGGQSKIAAKAPPTNKIDAKDFAVLRAEKAKDRGKGLQDEKMKPGKMMKADKGKMIKKDPTAPIKNVGVKDRYGMPMKVGKELGSRAMKAAKATRIGKIAAGVAAAALAAKAGLEKMYEKKTGKKPFTKRPDKKMGGGMMMQRKPMMAKKGKAVMLIIGMKPKKKMGGGMMMKKPMMMGGGLTEATQRLRAQGKMAGGMMQRPMMAMGGGMMPGYKKGKSVMAKGCKLGRKKPTKMYT